jgi:bacterioferritin-associated ferredoxin
LANQGHASSDDIAEACGAGGCCGGCRPAIDEILREGRPGRDLVFLPMYSEGA